MATTPMKGVWRVSPSFFQPEIVLMTGGIGHEAKAKTYHVGTEKAYHHLNRASDLFNLCLDFKQSDARAMLARSRVLITLASAYQPPRVATASLKDATSLLRDLLVVAPKSLSARETLAQACALLSSTLLEIDDTADDELKVWDGNIGGLAREALSLLEDVAGDKMDRMRQLRSDTAATHAPAMAETFLALSTAALTVSSLAIDLTTVDSHIELAEQALDQASNMASLAASAKSKSKTSSSSLITRVQLASGKSSIERLRHTFLLGVELDDDDFKALISDIKVLATDCREKAVKHKGSKGAAAATLAWEATKQLGDAKLTYANLLRMVWRRRKQAQGRKGSMGISDRRKLSRASDGSAEPTILEEEEEGTPKGLGIAQFSPRGSEAGRSSIPRKTSQLLDAFNFRRGSGDLLDATPRKSLGSPSSVAGNLRKSSAPLPSRLDTSDSRRQSGSDEGSKPSTPRSALAIIPDDTAVSSYAARPSHSSSTYMPSARRGSWLPTHGESAQSTRSRNRRLSSMSGPLVESDGVSAWSRKASVIGLATDETAEGLVPSTKLAQNAWEQLDSAVKQYKTALSLISSSDLPSNFMAQAKTDTLYAIAYCSLFMASLAPRLAIAAEKKISLLVTSEVYSTWAAREVGWSFLIEGTKESMLADRRTNSWRADEAGKKAVMLLLRTWWFRAVTTESIDVDTKVAAKDAVEVVVRRMKDKEGVKDGDVVRYRGHLARSEGELDGAEALFWRSVARILRGGGGFVMS